MLKAITLDFWNTLFVDNGSVLRENRRAEILREELMTAGARPSGVAIDNALRNGFEFFDLVWIKEQRTPSCAETIDVILAALEIESPEDVRLRIVSRFERLILEIPPRPMPGVRESLSLLAERYRLAVISDTGYSPGAVLRKLLDRHGLLSAFSFLYFSNEHEHCKPNPMAFRHTLAQLGVEPNEALHVGDIQRTDIAGAQKVGMATALFDATGLYNPARTTADFIVRNFGELLQRLAELDTPSA